ncbi:hypothetical protein A4R27_14355, partial [Priestia endophytica]
RDVSPVRGGAFENLLQQCSKALGAYSTTYGSGGDAWEPTIEIWKGTGYLPYHLDLFLFWITIIY